MVENNGGKAIPDWAYRDVMYILIYSITFFEVLERKLSDEEKEEVYNVFYHFEMRMKLKYLSTHHSKCL